MKNRKILSDRTRLIILSLMIITLCFNPYKVNASCAAPGTTEEELKKSDAVFTGYVVYISSANAILIDIGTKISMSIGFDIADAYETFSNGRRIVFEVDRSWKGVTTSSVTIRTGYSTGNSEGYSFELGSYYLVYASYAYGDPEKYLLTSLCHSTLRSPNNSEHISFLSTQPTLELSYFPAIIKTINSSSVIIFILLVALIYLFFRKRQSRSFK